MIVYQGFLYYVHRTGLIFELFLKDLDLTGV
jgi:hypothetical protein